MSNRSFVWAEETNKCRHFAVSDNFLANGNIPKIYLARIKIHDVQSDMPQFTVTHQSVVLVEQKPLHISVTGGHKN